MSNPNTILAERILAKLQEAGLLDVSIDQAEFKLKLETGKLVSADWASSLSSNPIATDEIKQTGD